MSIDIKEKEKQLKYHEKRMNRGGALIAAGIAFFVPVLIYLVTPFILGNGFDILGILMFGIPGLILIFMGFLIHNDSYSEAERIKKENPELIITQSSLKK